ncbi:MAG: DUF58 domain-containing protein, partial [Victivallales bacterium]|nr:DUF58 domain-containing protein [Victivallales bacterium]
AACGGMVQLPLVIANRSRRRRQAVLIRERLDFTEKSPFFHEAVAALQPYERRLVRRVMPAVKRGFYRLRQVELLGGDPGGFFCCRRRFRLPGEVMIYPEYLRLSRLPEMSRHRSLQAVTGRPLGVSGVGQEFFGVREYSAYDEMRFIHWKASARHRKLMVKEFEANTISHLYVLLDTEAAGVGDDAEDNNFEFLVRAAAAIVNCLADMHCRLTFVSARRGGVVRFSGEAVGIGRSIVNLLAVITPGTVAAEELLDHEFDRFDRNAICYCLSMSGSEKLVRRLNFLGRQGVDVRWFLAPRQYFPRHDAWGTVPVTAGEHHFADYGVVAPVVARQDSDIVRMLSHD